MGTEKRWNWYSNPNKHENTSTGAKTSTTRYVEIQLLNSKMYSHYAKSIWDSAKIISKGYYDSSYWIWKKGEKKTNGIKLILLAIILNPIKLKHWKLLAKYFILRVHQ